MIVGDLSQAFNQSVIHAQMRAMLESGEMIEQHERQPEPCCYLKGQPRPLGQVIQIRSAPVTSYFDPTITPPPPKSEAQVRRDRLAGDGPLLDQLPRRFPQARAKQPKAVNNKSRLTAIAGKITTCNWTIAYLQNQRSQITKSGELRVANATDDRTRQIYRDRLESDRRNIDRCLRDAQAKLQQQLDKKAAIEGGAS